MTLRLAAVMLLAFVLTGAALLWVAVMHGPALPSGGATVVVREGDRLADIAARLEDAGVVRSALLLRLWARVAGRDRAVQPGTYHFEDRVDLDGALAALAAGTPLIEITVPEGWTLREIAALLETRGLGAAADFLCLGTDPDFLVAAGVPGPQLEGYAFPDTYRFSSAMSPHEILETMVRRFHERFDAEHYRRAAARRMTTNQVVTLASIVEKETGLAAERPLIAAVFLNRLRIGMPLQSDPTVIYALPRFDGNLTRADLTHPSPYNTYVTGGLPPGPIANPGLAAIDAALTPGDSTALYFVARNDGSHEFSATLSEHNRAVARYQRPGAPPRGANIPVDSSPRVGHTPGHAEEEPPDRSRPGDPR